MADMPGTDGYLTHDIIVWGVEPSKNTIVSKGCYIEVPGLEGQNDAWINEWHGRIRTLLVNLNADQGEALKVDWSVCPDYSDMIGHYENQTTARNPSRWGRMIRGLRAESAKIMMEEGMLRRERIAIFLSIQCNSWPSGKASVELMESFFDSTARALSARLESLGSSLGGAKVRLMDDAEHALYFLRYFNPSGTYDKFTARQAESVWDFGAPILANAVRGDWVQTGGKGGKGEDLFFKFDDCYHAQLVIRRWPSYTNPLTLGALLRSQNRDLRVSLRVLPLDLEREIEKAEDLKNRLEKSGERSESDAAAAAQKGAQIRSLSTNEVKPFSTLFVVTVMAPSPDELRKRLVKVKQAITVSGGMQPHSVNEPTQALRVWNATWPGWTGGSYRGWDLYSEDTYLADLLPFHTTFTGYDKPDAIYNTPASGLAGISLWRGANDTPQHGIILGTTGGGKSVLMCDLISQVESTCGFILLVEEGESFTMLVKMLNGDTIVMSPDCPYTLNCFDTQGFPFTGTQKNSAVGLMIKMIGESRDDDTNGRRASMLGEYVDRAFADAYEAWMRQHPSETMSLWREALAVNRLLMTLPRGSDILDACGEFRRLLAEEPRVAKELLDAVSDAQATTFAQEHQTESLCRDYAASRYKAVEFPQLSQIVEMLKFEPMRHHDVSEVNHLATMLSGWTASSGTNGRFFDGPSNFYFNNRVIHFELSKLGNGASRLKEVTGFLISMYGRQRIIGMPRGVRKLFGVDEGARMLDVPGGEKILTEAYTIYRKYTCVSLLSTQQYDQLKKSRVKGVILGNSALKIMMKMDPDDLADLGAAINLPNMAYQPILKYLKPDAQSAANKASYFTIFSEANDGVLCGSAMCVPDRRLLYVASASGEHFDNKNRVISKYADPIEGVIVESERTVSA